MNPTLPIHCLFAAALDGGVLDLAPVSQSGRINRYRVDAVAAVKGGLPDAPEPGWQMIRVESETPTELAAPFTYHGVTGHLQYTSAAQAAALAQSRPEFSASDQSIRAVLIPIHKDAVWWSQPHDKRQDHFRDAKGHTKIGQRYIDRIFRKLYHSRYLGRKAHHDFLTYFEFQQPDEGAFRELLAKLRDPALNPEWQHVDLEFEIWMTKLT